MPEKSAFDQAHDREAILSYLMYDGPGSPRRREVALELAHELTETGLEQLRSEMGYRAREMLRAGHADNYNPWTRD
jgi:hypothetical protein